MGGCESKPKSKAAARPKPKVQQKAKKNLNPEDYIFSKRSNELLIKQEGSIDGEQFNIEECKNCDIFLLDHLATSFIDYCEDCRIYIGPTATSVFLRNCSNCCLVIACQQYRCRDCLDCKIALYCGTEPIIESSQRMSFACFDFNYFSLRGQMAQAGLKPWNNKWWMIYDFNKKEGTANWDLLPQEEVKTLLRVEASGITVEELENESVVPITLGSRPWPCKETCFLLFLPDSEAFVEAFLSRCSTSEWALCRSRAVRLQEDKLKVLFSWTKEPKLVARCQGQEITGMQVCGISIQKQVQDALSLTGLATGAKNIRVVPEKETDTLATHFFQTWKDEV